MSGTVDMRDCRLDTVTFIDPVAGGTFAVARVGRNVNYLCKGGVRTDAEADDICAGPFGDLVLAGRLGEPGETPRNVFAVWHMEKAAPCCGWRILEERAGRKFAALPGFRWLDGVRAPRLGQVGFASIFFDELHQEGSAVFSAPKIAMHCTVTVEGVDPAAQ
jgi:hypothetical protein